MKRYLSAEGCAMSTITVYSNTLSMLLKIHPDFDKYNSEQLVYILSEIKDPIYRSSIRNVVLKVHRDMLGKSINIPFIKKPERLQGVYTFDEVKKIFSYIHNAKHLAIAKLLYIEGFRVGEVVSILKCDCDKSDKSILIRETKNKKDYKKYLDDSTVIALSNYCGWLKERNFTIKKYLFEGMDNNQYSKRSIQEFMRAAIKNAGLPIKGSCHVFRRSSSTWKLEAGWSVQHIAASLNNTPKTVSKYYAYVRPDYLRTLLKPAM
jgi:integrase